MKDFWRRGSRRWLLILSVPAVAALAASATAVARTTASAAPATPQQVERATIRSGKPIVPRVVHPTNGLHRGQNKAKGEQEPEPTAPVHFPRGTAKTGPPQVISDTGPRRGRVSWLLGGLTASGSFADLNDFVAATAENTCPGFPNACNFNLPPDTQMAAGRNEVVEDVNNYMFVYKKDGSLKKSFPLTDLFQPQNQTYGLTDPKIVFDPTTDYYYATEMACVGAGCGGTSWTSMGISLAVTKDPAGAWTVYDRVNNGNVLQDQEKLGFSGDKITFAVNAYGDKGGTTSGPENVVVMQKSDAVAGQTLDWVVFSDSGGSTFAFDSMPTTPVNASTSDNTQYVVWDGQQSSSNYMKLIRITGTPDAGPVNTSVTQLSIADQTAPPRPLAQGGFLCTGSKGPCTGTTGDKQNFQSAVVQGNDLWTVATDGCTPPGDNTTRSCTRLVELNLGNNSVSNDSDLGTNGTYRINASVTKDSDNHVFFGFTISSSSTYGTAAIDGSALPLPATLQRIDFASGDSAYTDGRWGDYSGTQQDPSNTHDVWSAQEFAACNTGCSNFGSTGWGTAIGQFTFREPQISSISPTFGPPSGGTTVDIYGSEFANGGTTVKFGANTSGSVTWIDSTHIQASSPAGSVGTVDVTAQTGAGTSNTSSADQFTYRKFPTTTTYTGATSGDYNDVVTLKAHLKNNDNSLGVAGKTVSFSVGAESCSGTTNSSGDASCSVTLADLPGGSYSVVATFTGDVDYEASGASTPFTVNKEDTKLVYGGPLTSHYHDSISASATLTDPDDKTPISGMSITFTLGADTCSASTNSSGVASCLITPSQVSATTISASYAGDSYFQSASDTQSFSITPEETTVSYTGPTVILAGASGATLTATLVEEGSNDADSDAGSIVPNPTETVTLSIGTQSCTATTTSTSGDVSCVIPSVTVPLGPQTVGASFAGDSYYQASSDSKTATVFAFPSSGVFTLGDLTVAGAGSSTVTWWSNNWYLLDSLSGGQAPPPFKGFVGTVTLPNTTPANICSGTWTTSGGNSPPPPATVPSYMGVIVASKITKKGTAISGGYAKIVVVKTDPGYAPGPLNQGTGKIVATFCP